MRILICLMIVLSMPMTAGTASAQGKLSQIREDVRDSPEDESAPRRKRRNRSCTSDDDDYSFGSFIGKAILYTAGSPFWLPPTTIQDDYCSPGYFPEYPYQDGIDGYMMIDPWAPIKPFEYSLQARTEYADDFDSISRIGTRILIDTTSRFGIDSEVNNWRESLGAGQRDELWTGDANLIFRFAQSNRIQMRTGLGVNWIADDVGSDFGFNFTYQGDFMPRKPWIISAELDLGSIGDQTLFHGRVTTGLQWRRAEVFIGYDHYAVGQTALNGFLSGVRLWF